MQELIKAQNGPNPNIQSEELELGNYQFDFIAEEAGEVTHIDMKHLNMIARTLGAP